jgi:hypothetical protein
MFIVELIELERRQYGSVDTLSNATNAAQRQNRRRELEEKYGIQIAPAMAANNLRHGQITNNGEMRESSSIISPWNSKSLETRRMHVSPTDDEPLLSSEHVSNSISSPQTMIKRSE